MDFHAEIMSLLFRGYTAVLTLSGLYSLNAQTPVISSF